MANNFWNDTFEKLKEEGGELTVGTAKKAIETIMGNGGKNTPKSPEDLLKKESGTYPKNYTELDKESLGKTYQKQDEMEIEILKKRLFQNVQSESEMAHRNAVKVEQERLDQQNKPLENPHKNETFSAPKGKKSKNIFGGRRKAVTNMENSPAKGK